MRFASCVCVSSRRLLTDLNSDRIVSGDVGARLFHRVPAKLIELLKKAALYLRDMSSVI